MNRRLERISSQLREELGLLLPLVKHPELGFVTFTHVDISPDLRNARVAVSVLPTQGHEDPEATLSALQHSASFLQHHIGKRLSLRVTPILTFVLDKSMAIQSSMETLIREARASDADHGTGAGHTPTPESDDA